MPVPPSPSVVRDAGPAVDERGRSDPAAGTAALAARRNTPLVCDHASVAWLFDDRVKARVLGPLPAAGQDASTIDPSTRMAASSSVWMEA